MTLQLVMDLVAYEPGESISLPTEDAGVTPVGVAMSLRNNGASEVTVTTVGGDASRFAGWFLREHNIPALPFTIGPGASVAVEARVVGRANAAVLESGAYTGSFRVSSYVTSAGAGTAAAVSWYLKALVRDTTLPDLRITKQELFRERFFLHFPLGGQGSGANPFGLNTQVETNGFRWYFENVLLPYIAWAGVRPVFFIDRPFGNDGLSNNAGDVPFDGRQDLEARGGAELAAAVATIDEGFAYLGGLDADVWIYNGSLANDTDFSGLATAENWRGLFDRMMGSLDVFLRLPNLRGMMFDDPFGPAPTDARTHIYEGLRKVLQARSCAVCQEPRAEDDDPVFNPENGWGPCSAFGYFQRTDPAWGTGTWTPFAGQMPTDRLATVEVVQWQDGTGTVPALLPYMIAWCIHDSHVHGRTIPYRFVGWPVGWRVTAGLSSDELLTQVNAALAGITGDA